MILTPRVLVIGAGQMGSGMARRCIDAGLDVAVIDLDMVKLVNFEKNRSSAHSFSIFVATPLISLICVIDAAQTRAVLFGSSDESTHFHHGLAHKLAAGSTVVLTPTIGEADMVAIGAHLAALGLACVDAPVSGGPVRALDGTMSMMLAGDPKHIGQAQAVLDALSNAQTVIGPRIGTATCAKLLNNALAASHLHNHAQALAAAQRVGVSSNTLQAVLNGSSGQSWIGSQRALRFLTGDTRVQARMALLAKDSALALDMLRAQGLPTAWLEPAVQAFAAACAQGWHDRDDTELIRFVAQAIDADSLR